MDNYTVVTTRCCGNRTPRPDEAQDRDRVILIWVTQRAFAQVRGGTPTEGTSPDRRVGPGVARWFELGSRRGSRLVSRPVRRQLWTNGCGRSILLIMLGETTRDRVSERREATRKEILEAAWALARERGLAQLTLRDIADRMGMRPPSLYSHVDVEERHLRRDVRPGLDGVPGPDAGLRGDLSPGRRRRRSDTTRAPSSTSRTSDLARNQLMNQRTIPGFEPTPEAYAPAVETARVLANAAGQPRHHRPRQDLDLYVALVGGLVDAQLANDPGGDRWCSPSRPGHRHVRQRRRRRHPSGHRDNGVNR